MEATTTEQQGKLTAGLGGSGAVALMELGLVAAGAPEQIQPVLAHVAAVVKALTLHCVFSLEVNSHCIEEIETKMKGAIATMKKLKEEDQSQQEGALLRDMFKLPLDGTLDPSLN